MCEVVIAAPHLIRIFEMKRFIILFFCVFAVGRLSAQLSQVRIGVDGFTCSLCAKGVEEQFKSLDFVQNVKTDLKKTEFTLKFKPGVKIDISKISNAVSDGGFTVRDLSIVAKGSLAGSVSSGYYLVTKNSPDIGLLNVSDEFHDQENVQLEGKVNLSNNKVNVSSIKKL